MQVNSFCRAPVCKIPASMKMKTSARGFLNLFKKELPQRFFRELETY